MENKNAIRATIIVIATFATANEMKDYLGALHRLYPGSVQVSEPVTEPPESSHAHPGDVGNLSYALSQVAGISVSATAAGLAPDDFVIMQAFPYRKS